jgi:hypothetical protein
MSAFLPIDAVLRNIEDAREAEWDRYSPRPATTTYRMRRSVNADMRSVALSLVPVAHADRLDRTEKRTYRSGGWLR